MSTFQMSIYMPLVALTVTVKIMVMLSLTSLVN
jgi:hypothetical protein